MDKYYKENTNSESRLTKNKDIYNKLDDEALDNMELTTNIAVIDADTSNLDIDQIRNYLNNKNKPKKVDDETVKDDVKDTMNEKLDDTKEYDLKKVLEEAHKNKDEDYDKERFKKLRDTQYDILKSLDLNRKDDPSPKETLSREETEVINLMNTVEDKKLDDKDDDDDLMSALKGDDGTEVLEPMKDDDEDEIIEEEIIEAKTESDVETKDEDSENKEKEDNDEEDESEEEPDVKPSLVEELEKTIKLSKEDMQTAIDKADEETTDEDADENEEDEEKAKEKAALDDNTFYTGSYKIKEKDFDTSGFDDLKGDVKKNHPVVKVIIIIVVIAVICALVYFADKYFKLGLFR